MASPTTSASPRVSNPFECFSASARQRHDTEALAILARDWLALCQNDPEQVLASMRQNQTLVVVLDKGVVAASALLRQLGFQPGFVAPSSHWRYTLLFDGLCGLTNQPSGAVQPQNGLVVLPSSLVQLGFVAYVLYHWLAFRKGLPGYQPDAQKLYATHWELAGGTLSSAAEHLEEGEIIALRQAIQREMDAVLFLRTLQDEVIRPKTLGNAFRQGMATA